ncbi:MAG: MFS transporter [Mucilaginibacter polytrichastri]|nr:MFS transporter [Mucilaginibacter polytrichastri]
MALCTGLIVANIYYCQPLVVLIAEEFHIAESVAGKINYFTQGGYALGLFFLVPLGDMFERKKQILCCTALAIVALLTAAVAKSFFLLCLASVFIGFASIVPQLIIPMAASLVGEQKRGQTVGTIMSGLLVGILLSRTLSGGIAHLMGWRAVFYIAAGICLVLILVMGAIFPQSVPSYKGSYGRLMKSIAELVRTQPLLREASAISFLSFAVITAFWTVMVLYLSDQFQYSSYEIGLFGVAGAAGALAAPLVGSRGDSGNPISVICIGLALQAGSYLLFYFTGENLWLFIVGVIAVDIGQQAIHVTNQTRIYASLPEARNRLNTVYMTVAFIGAAGGSAFGLMLWQLGKWPLFCLGCLSLIALNFIILLLRERRKKRVIAAGS